ncbi:MAG: DUF1573 domain-containing protein [Flavobacterium sp.]
MKIKLFIVATLLVATACKNENKTEVQDAQIANEKSITEENMQEMTDGSTSVEAVASTEAPVMTFEKTEHDFGTITQGENVTHIFKFTNTGKSDLLIANAKGSCGCTVPEYPRTPIKPGESGEMKVTFSSAGRNGMQSKTVDITTNTAEGHQQLLIKASIK